MNILIICLFIAVLMPYLSKVPLAIAMNKLGGYDNCYPREQQARLQGFGARASGAHQNSFESLIVFSTAALTALVTNHNTPMVQYLAITYIVSRVVYHAMYLMNLATLRSLVWAVGYISCLFILGACF